MQFKITGDTTEKAVYLRKFIYWLQQNYPVIGNDVTLDVKLSRKNLLKFELGIGGFTDAFAITTVTMPKAVVTIATGFIYYYPIRLIEDMAHEWKHLQQKFNEGKHFTVMAHEQQHQTDALEIEARAFSEEITKKYLKLVGNKL